MNERETKKREILEEFFAMRGNAEPKARVAVTKKIDTYINIFKDDEQIRDLKQLVRAYRHSLDYNDFHKTTTLATPIFNRLLNGDSTWDFYDTRIAISCIGMSWDYKAVLKLSNLITHELKSYKEHIDYNYMNMAMYMNITASIYRIKFQFDLNEEDLKTVNEAFKYYIDKIEELNKVFKYPYTEAYLLVRKGVYYQDKELVDKGIKLAKTFPNKNIVKMLRNSVKEAHGYVNFGMSNSEYNTRIGDLIYSFRKYHGYSRLQLAKKIGVSHPLIAAMERGQRTLAEENRLKLIKVFNCPEDALSINSKEIKQPPRDETEKVLDFIYTTSSNLEKEDVQIVAYLLHIFNRKAIQKFINRLVEKMDDTPRRRKE